MGIVKKAVAIIAIILMILTSSITIAVSEQKGKVVTDTLRLRKEASLESTVLELLYKDNEVEIVGEEGDWYKVKYNTYTGYVSKEFVEKESQNSTETTNGEKNTNNENNNQTTENKISNEVNQNNNNESGENKNSNEVNQSNNNQSAENNNNQTTQNNTNNVQKAVVNNDLDVHILPLINSNVIGKFKANTNVELVSVTGVWTYVKTNELAGWIRLDKISIGNEATQESNQTTTQPENNQTSTQQENNTTENNQTTEQKNEQTNTNNKREPKTTMYSSAKTYYVKSSAVNVREKSNTDSSVITTVSQNAEIKVVGEESSWYKVEVSGKSGYILKSLLSTTKTEVTTRSTTQEREGDSKKTEEKTSTKSSASSSSKGNNIIAYAKKYLGCRYVYGGSGPSTFDCSGFTMYVYKHFGYSLPHNAVTQARVGKYVAKSDLQPGDLIIFNNSANTSIGHVGMYVGGGSFIHASSGSGKIIISSLSGSYYKARYVTARRLI